jgi:hypothetical protein
MPFESSAQQRFLYAHPEKVGGKKKLAEWSAATDFKHLPEKKKPEKTVKKFAYRKKGNP